MDGCQFLQLLGHEGCVALVVVGLLVLAFSVLILSIMAYYVVELWSHERRKMAEEVTTRHRVEYRAALLTQLSAGGKDSGEVDEWLDLLG